MTNRLIPISSTDADGSIWEPTTGGRITSLDEYLADIAAHLLDDTYEPVIAMRPALDGRVREQDGDPIIAIEYAGAADIRLVREPSPEIRAQWDEARGVRSAAQALGRKGGAARSERKIQAARANGAKGGRPRKRAEG